MITLTFSIKVDGLEDDTLVVRQFEGYESLSNSVFSHNQICHGFRFTIALASRRNNLTPEQIVDKSAVLSLYQDLVCVQRWHGIVRSFTQGEIGYNHSFYSLVLVPALERLSLHHNSRIFQQQNAEEIISTLLKEMEVKDFSFNLSRKCKTREFCVQYRETDLDFVQRLAAEEGMIYHIEHSDDKHTLIFSDNTSSLPSLAQPVVHNALAGGILTEPFIYHFEQHTQSDVAEVTMQDRSFKKPDYNFAQNVMGKNLSFQRTNYTHFDFPGRFKDDESGKAFNQYRLEYLRREAQTAQGKSNQPLLQAGYRFTLSDHLNPACNKEWVVVSVIHKGEQAQALEEAAGNGATSYYNECKFIPATQTWRATPQPKPLVDGPMVAEVVGPAGEEIYCDEHGRVKVHFPWDRNSQKDEKSSCWVRVAQAWAGSQYGMIAIPRIGHEVIVSFLHGDPDQPIITGCTYHAMNVVPYPLPENKTKTTWRSNSHKAEGFNEISFEDEAGNEQIFIHAQKDQNKVVNNDETTKIGHDRSENVGNNETIAVGNNRAETVGNDETITVGNDRTETVGRNEVVTIKGNCTEDTLIAKTEKVGAAKELSVGAEYRVSVGGDMNKTVAKSDMSEIGGIKKTLVSDSLHYEVKNEITLSTGKASLTMKSDGTIVLQGADITLTGSGEIKVKASQNVVIKGKKILEN